MPIFTGFCKKCGEFEQIFLTFKEAEETSKLTCPECGKKVSRNDFEMPSRFMGTFGVEGTAPSKRYTYKKSMKSPDPNKGSAV